MYVVDICQLHQLDGPWEEGVGGAIGILMPFTHPFLIAATVYCGLIKVVIF